MDLFGFIQIDGAGFMLVRARCRKVAGVERQNRGAEHEGQGPFAERALHLRVSVQQTPAVRQPADGYRVQQSCGVNSEAGVSGTVLRKKFCEASAR